MREIRKLFFLNAAGESYSLNGENGVYASKLAGFGFNLSPSFVDLNRGFFMSVGEENEPQQPIPFTVTFTKAPYKTYKTWVDWINAAGCLKLGYRTPDGEDYCRDIVVTSVQKGELNALGWLEVPCSCACVTPWYPILPERFLTDGAAGDSAGTMEVQGAGHIPSAFELECNGPIYSPKLSLVGTETGKTYGICSVGANILTGEKLKISTRFGNSYVKRILEDGTEYDLLDELDVTTNPFFRIPVDEPCDLKLEAADGFSGTLELKIYHYYRSV